MQARDSGYVGPGGPVSPLKRGGKKDGEVPTDEEVRERLLQASTRAAAAAAAAASAAAASSPSGGAGRSPAGHSAIEASRTSPTCSENLRAEAPVFVPRSAPTSPEPPVSEPKESLSSPSASKASEATPTSPESPEEASTPPCS